MDGFLMRKLVEIQNFGFISLFLLYLLNWGTFDPRGHFDVMRGSYFMNLDILSPVAVSARKNKAMMRFSCKFTVSIENNSFSFLAVYSGSV